MNCVIIGAGKIARGFVGHLLYLSDIPFTFIEKSEALTALINERGAYTVNILGAPEKNCLVQGAHAILLDELEAASDAIADADAVFDAVGGRNLSAIVPVITRGIEKKAERMPDADINFITCENWKQPAAFLREEVGKLIPESVRPYLEQHVGFTEAVIMRSAIESPEELLEKDPLIVNVQDFWEFPVDDSRVKGQLPAFGGLKLIPAFTGFLERKFYTYNAANGTTSFLGALLGYEHIADAAHDERILKVLDGVYRETARALSIRHSFPYEEQWAFTRTSLRKLQDETIVDFVERNARDPIRKLGPDDRLVGSARMVLDCGIIPEHLAIAIAAAIFYENENDESALELARIREEGGIDAVLEKVCRIEPDGQLGRLVKEKVAVVKEMMRGSRRVIIIGAGKTGRGFLARLFASDSSAGTAEGAEPDPHTEPDQHTESSKQRAVRGNIRLIFIDRDKKLIRDLRERGSYTIRFYGNRLPQRTISGYEAYTWEEAEAEQVFAKPAEAIFVSVGGQNLEDVGEKLGQCISAAQCLFSCQWISSGQSLSSGPCLSSEKPSMQEMSFSSGHADASGNSGSWEAPHAANRQLCIITAENASAPADRLQRAILKSCSFAKKQCIMVSESTVFCTTNSDGAVDILSEQYPYLQYDAERLPGRDLQLPNLRPVKDFAHFLTRKLYTYNCASCVIAYLGWLKGYENYADAANDPEITEKLDRNYEQGNRAMCLEFGYSEADQTQFAQLSRDKFLDRSIIDTIERNARDPKRKLKKEERIIGPALLMQKYQLDTSVLEETAAAAILYAMEQDGEDKTPARAEAYLEDVCGLSAEDPLRNRILQQFASLSLSLLTETHKIR